MDSICRVIVYILAVNIAYLVFSLIKQGFKHYSNYIAELIFVAILSIYLLQIDFSPILACIISAILTIVVVVLPIYFQGQIDALMSEGRYDELKGYASLKASLAWANPNYHLEELANITAEYYETPTVMLEKLRAQLGQGEPYDGMTRVFLGIIHFNNRNFHELINDIRVDGDLDKQSFEELLYLVRAFLETTRYDEAVQAEIALERKVCEDKENIADRMSNVLINRFVFYAFMGWIKEYDLLMESKSEDFKSLPKELKNFWRGVCLFYSGEYALGENLMNNVISNLPEDADVWREFMVKRRNGMIENKEFFNQHVLDKLKDLYTEYNAQIGITIAESEKELSNTEPVRTVTNILTFIISLISVSLIVICNVNDVVELVNMGANSSSLVKDGEYFRLFTYMFIHVGWMHLIMNLAALRYFSPTIETIAGWPVFLLIFFASGIGGAALSVYNGVALTVGVSGAVFGLFAAALVFERTKTRGIANYSCHISFTTLVFIIGANFVFGLFEKGIDNSCHLGGFLTGAVLSFILIPFINRLKLRKFIDVVSVIACSLILCFSCYTMYRIHDKNGFYPSNLKEEDFVKVDIDKILFSFDIPRFFKYEEEKVEAQEFVAVGPLAERLFIIAGSIEETPEEFLEGYVSQKIGEFEEDSDIDFESVIGPELYDSNNKVYRIKWKINVADKPIVLEEHLLFIDGVVFVVRITTSTTHSEAYGKIFQHCVESITTK